jgi:hypothetical protein
VEFQREIQDAKLLLDFAVANAKSVAEELIASIKKAETWLTTVALPPEGDRTAFEAAYRNLTQVLAPVTAETLKATSDAPAYGRKAFLWPFGPPLSVARLWSRRLWWYALFAALVILFSENTTRILAEYFPADRESLAVAPGWPLISMVLQSLEPFAYGALGTLAYLLRSAHTYIYERTFDPRRTPEYNNRMLLGMIGGGAIKLFVTETTTDEGAVIELSAAALAFIAGYNSDFLFSAIERVTAAILPKVGLESVRRAAPDRVAMMTVERLVTRYATATEDEKKIIERLVDRLTLPQPPDTP